VSSRKAERVHFFHLLRPGEELRARAGAMLGGVRRALDPIDREHRATNQAFVAEQCQDLTKHRRDRLTRTADEVRDRGEVRLGVAGQCDEQHVVATCTLDRARADHPLRIGQQHRLEQHRRRMRRRADRVIAVVRIERRQVQCVDHVMHRMRERAGHQLRFQIHRQQPRAHVHHLVARHPRLP